MELTSSCTTLDISMNHKDDTKLDVETNLVNRITGEPSSPSKGVAIQSKKDPTILKYQIQSTRLPTTIARLMPGAGTYQILHTDYNNYAILWTCSNLKIAHSDLVWILGRTREINANKRAEIYSVLAGFNIDSDRLVLSKNKDCPT
ncbi:apolipoprotein D-like isoform X2 [Chrysoperla carnea]|nr:apolipoprotein D-like isoform X2 [Chrysoperla carnea]